MLTIREIIKTLYNALLQRLKKHRGNWEQNDPTADDYIKNRPFYTDETKTETVVKTKTFTATSSHWWGSPFAFIPVVGETYKVTFDDKEYICRAYLDEYNDKCIGNLAVAGDGTKDTGEPFYYFWYDSYEYGLCVRDQGKHTITIEKIDVTKIDERYLPGNLVRQESINELYDYANELGNAVWNRVSYAQSQNLSTAQKQTARTNIGAVAIDDLATVANSGDYNDLENRPCYLEVEMTPYLGVTNKTISMSYSNGLARYGRILSNPAAMPVSGTTYRIIYNGIEYDIISSNPGPNLLGNKSLYNTSYENTGEPFAVLCDTANLWLYHTGTATSATISIYTITSKNVKQLSDELIPDTIARVSELPQSDWNQNDSKQIDYIKNRTHYEEIIIGDTLYEGSANGSEHISSPGEIAELYSKMSVGDDISFAVDGIEYKGRVKYFQPMSGDEYLYIGNLNLYLSAATSSEEDYLLTCSNGGSYMIETYINNARYTGDIIVKYPDITVVHPLDEKFIPSTIARTEDIEGLATEEYVDTKVADLVNTAPEALDTLKELSTALGDDPNFATTVLTQLGNKADVASLEGLATEEYVNSPKSYFDLVDEENGKIYRITMKNGNLVSQLKEGETNE